MELRHLRYFVALASSLSFTKAAERVHVAQSTLSHQIKQLEEEMGRPLFDRIGKRISLTEAGEAFLGHALRAIQEIDQGIGTLKAFGAEISGAVRIGATQTFNLGFIPECVAAFITLHPTVQPLVSELSADAIGNRLRNGELDLGISYRPESQGELHFEPLFDEEMVLVVGRNHPLAQRKRVRMVELNRQRMVLLPKEFSTRRMIDDCFRTCAAEPVVAAEMNAVAPMLATVARTDVAAIVAQNAVPVGDELRAIALESPTPVRTPGILWKREAQHPQQVRVFAGIVRKLAHGGDMQARQAHALKGRTPKRNGRITGTS